MVSAKEFSGLNWICEHWGSAALIYPGYGAKDHCRAAIQMLSKPEHATVYAHLGWAEIGGKPVFIHAGGGIGANGVVDGVAVDVGPLLAGYTLPAPPADVSGLLRDILELPGTLAPEAVAWPLLLYTLGAVLGHTPFSIYLAGGSGARKTSLALVMQSFFGYQGGDPAFSWESTANSLEGLAFAAKDIAILIDDFAPTGDARAHDDLKRKAARVLRSQGNHTGRGRMKADGSLAGDRPPRGSMIVTGEDLPPGHSVRARCLFLEIQPDDPKRGIKGDVNLKALSEAQKKARVGCYAGVMAAWIQWLAPKLEETRKRLRERMESLRPEWASLHGRTTDAVARLQAVWEIFAGFAVATGAISREERDRYHKQVIEALRTVSAAQSSIQKQADQVEQFAELLRSLFNSGRAHLKNKDDIAKPPKEPSLWGWKVSRDEALHPNDDAYAVPQGAPIGWVDDVNVYLDPNNAYAELSRLAQENREALFSPRTFWKRLGEKGVLRTEPARDGVRCLVRVRIGGKRERVCEIKKNALYAGKTGPSGPSGPKASETRMALGLETGTSGTGNSGWDR